MSISPELKRITLLLEESYHNLGGLIDFMHAIRTDKNDFSGKKNCGLKTIAGLFSKSVWEHVSGAGGHIVVKHKLTHIVINYSNHKDPIDAGAAVTIAETVQKHINALAKDFLGIKGGKWGVVPDFKTIARRIVAEK